MKKLLILSGKGGTGKTTVASAIIEFSKSRAFADCDVDAPNLHLIQDFKGKAEVKSYIGSKKALINKEKCTLCGKCIESCRFGAIEHRESGYVVDEYGCEGCAVCALVCPAQAVSLEDDIAGETMVCKDSRVFSTAKLKMGRGNSGKLVSEVKKNLFSNVNIKETGLVVIDGSPGIGCPVIASSSGVDIALIVSEPSLSGISDMKRLAQVLKSFGIKTLVCVNKADLAPEQTERIKEWCCEQGLDFVGEIPYDKEVVRALNSGKSIAGVNSPARDGIFEIYEKIITHTEVEV